MEPILKPIMSNDEIKSYLINVTHEHGKFQASLSRNFDMIDRSELMKVLGNKTSGLIGQFLLLSHEFLSFANNQVLSFDFRHAGYEEIVRLHELIKEAFDIVKGEIQGRITDNLQRKNLRYEFMLLHKQLIEKGLLDAYGLTSIQQPETDFLTQAQETYGAFSELRFKLKSCDWSEPISVDLLVFLMTHYGQLTFEFAIVNTAKVQLKAIPNERITGRS
jgi:hypothetical protein